MVLFQCTLYPLWLVNKGVDASVVLQQIYFLEDHQHIMLSDECSFTYLADCELSLGYLGHGILEHLEYRFLPITEVENSTHVGEGRLWCAYAVFLLR